MYHPLKIFKNSTNYKCLWQYATVYTKNRKYGGEAFGQAPLGAWREGWVAWARVPPRDI
jgi:hypothetical protein